MPRRCRDSPALRTVLLRELSSLWRIEMEGVRTAIATGENGGTFGLASSNCAFTSDNGIDRLLPSARFAFGVPANRRHPRNAHGSRRTPRREAWRIAFFHL